MPKPTNDEILRRAATFMIYNIEEVYDAEFDAAEPPWVDPDSVPNTTDIHAAFLSVGVDLGPKLAAGIIDWDA